MRLFTTLSSIVFLFYFVLFGIGVCEFLCIMPEVAFQYPLFFTHFCALNAARAVGITVDNASDLAPYLLAYALIAPRLFRSRSQDCCTTSTPPQRGTECASPRT